MSASNRFLRSRLRLGTQADGDISLTSEGFNKKDLEAIGARAGMVPFGPEDHVPEWKAG